MIKALMRRIEIRSLPTEYCIQYTVYSRELVGRDRIELPTSSL
jgi:hypothetical protein